MRRIAVVGLLLLSLFLLTTGCVSEGETTAGEGQFDTKYCSECKVYHPLDHPHFQTAEAPVEGAETE